MESSSFYVKCIMDFFKDSFFFCDISGSKSRGCPIYCKTKFNGGSLMYKLVNMLYNRISNLNPIMECTQRLTAAWDKVKAVSDWI